MKSDRSLVREADSCLFLLRTPSCPGRHGGMGVIKGNYLESQVRAGSSEEGEDMEEFEERWKVKE